MRLVKYIIFKIQTIEDVYKLKLKDCLPVSNEKELEYCFKAWLEEINERTLPSHACMYHFDHEEDGKMLVNHLYEIEYVDVETAPNGKYSQIGFMQSHQIFLIFILQRLSPREVENWLEDLSDINV